MKMLLIAGHGAGDPGATAKLGGKSYREADEARVLATELTAALRGLAEVDAYPFQRNAYADYQNGTLRTLAQFSKYDYVLELHFNALAQDLGDGKTKGVECYVTTTEKGTAVEEAICRNIAALGLRNRGVKRKDWAVIRTAKSAGVSAALLEVCFLDDADDMAVYTTRRVEIVQAVARAIREGFGLKPAATARQTVQAKAGLSDKTMDYLAAYPFADDLFQKLAGAMQ